MSTDDGMIDPYAIYDEDDAELGGRGPLRGRKAARRHTRKQRVTDDIADLAATTGLEGGFTPTYKPARWEAVWLLDSLRPFYEQDQISDVEAQIKGGKEASVYRCVAHPSIGEGLLAAKVYRPRQFRNLRNDKMYREDRPILTADGRPVKRSDHRIMRAVGKKTAFGVQVTHTSWLMYEFTTMERLYRAGGAVPRPVAAGENAILMTYYGDRNLAAPTLNEISLARDEAGSLFDEVLRNIELMLRRGVIHGDLSAYNILYWEGKVVLIDFPQITDSFTNRHAREILQRDIERVCEYFRRQGVRSDATALLNDLWTRHVREDAASNVRDEMPEFIE